MIYQRQRTPQGNTTFVLTRMSDEQDIAMDLAPGSGYVVESLA